MQSDIIHLESDWPLTEENGRGDNRQVVTLAFQHLDPTASITHCAYCTSTSREMTFKFQTVKKKKLTKNFSLCFFSSLKELYKIITKKSIISYTYLYDNIVYVILL